MSRNNIANFQSNQNSFLFFSIGIGIKKSDYTKILADEVTLKNVVILISRVIEDGDKLCSPRTLEEGSIKSDGKLVKVGEKWKILVIS